MGLDSFNFADALLGILGQRLVKRICKDCRQEYHPERSEYDELAEAFGAEAFATLNQKFDGSFVLYRGKGCASCNKTGYRGRLGIHELFIATDEMKRLIQSKARVAEMLEQAKAEGMTTLVQDGRPQDARRSHRLPAGQGPSRSSSLDVTAPARSRRAPLAQHSDRIRVDPAPRSAFVERASRRSRIICGEAGYEEASRLHTCPLVARASADK
jgi:hypothetical protein